MNANRMRPVGIPALAATRPSARLWATSRARARQLLWRAVIRGATLLKRLLDVAGSLALGLALSPVLVLVPLLIKLEDGGPVLFWQPRVGQNGRLFQCPKYRSMVVDAEACKAALLATNDHGDSVTFKMKRDPRITRMGRLIRRASIDELPQLWCILKGEMSLVGPRPPVPSEVESYSLDDRRRLDVRPGLTCLWQVSGRGDIPFPEQVRLDVEYIENRGLRKDIELLLRTVPAVLLGKGAY